MIQGYLLPENAWIFAVIWILCKFSLAHSLLFVLFVFIFKLYYNVNLSNYTLIFRTVTEVEFYEHRTLCGNVWGAHIYHPRSVNATRKNILEVQFKLRYNCCSVIPFKHESGKALSSRPARPYLCQDNNENDSLPNLNISWIVTVFVSGKSFVFFERPFVINLL